MGNYHSNQRSMDFEGLGDIFYPILSVSDPLVSLGNQADDVLSLFPDTIIVTCGIDPLKVQADRYAKRLESQGIKVYNINLPEAIHWFLETNYPEMYDNNPAKSSIQEKICQECNAEISKALLDSWTKL